MDTPGIPACGKQRETPRFSPSPDQCILIEHMNNNGETKKVHPANAYPDSCRTKEEEIRNSIVLATTSFTQHRQSHNPASLTTLSVSQPCQSHNPVSLTAVSLPSQRTCLHIFIPAKRRESRKSNRGWRNSFRKWERTWKTRWIEQDDPGWRVRRELRLAGW